jgi:hypothetical protein
MSSVSEVKVIQPTRSAIVKHRLHARHRSGHPRNVITVQPFAAVPTTAFTNSSTITFRIPSETLQIVEGLVLKWTVAESGGSNSVQLPPVHFFNQSIEVRVNNGIQLINTLYPEVEYFAACALVDKQDQTPRFFDDVNMSSSYYLGQDSVIPASGKRVFYHRLRSSLFQYWRPFVKQSGYTELRIKCQPSVVSGSGTLSLTNCQLIVEEERLSDEEEKFAIATQMSTKSEWQYLDWLKISSTSQTLTAGTEFSFDLTAIGLKHVPFLIFAIRADGYSNTSGGNLKFLSLGSNNTTTEATVNLADPSGRPILDNGTGNLDYEYVKNAIWNQHFSSDFNNRNLHILPFCASVKDAMKGIKNGYMEFNKEKFTLRLRPSSAGTACVQTLTCVNPANDGGFYKLAYRGDLTDPLAHDATAATMKTAFEALPAVQNYPGGPLTVTFSGALTATRTATFASTVQPPRDLVNCVAESLNDGAVGEKCTTTITTQGVEGFTTSSTMTVDVFVPFYSSLWQYGPKIKINEHN